MNTFRLKKRPHASLIRMKVKEFKTSIVVSNSNKELSEYLQTVAHSRAPALKETMARNFQKNLTISEFAVLCHRSVSSFKRDFHEQYVSPPGRCLEKRLESSMTLLRGTEKSISAIVLECGFVDMSHCSKLFKSKFGVTPSTFRKSSNF